MQTPAIRARQADDQHATRMLVVEALAALTTALTTWSDGDGAVDLVGLVDEAFSILRRSGASDGAPAVPGEPR